MKNKLFLLTTFFLINMLIFSTSVLAEISDQDKIDIENQIVLIETSINDGDLDTIQGIISPNARAGLMSEINTELKGKTISFQQDITKIKTLDNPNQVEVKCTFYAEGINWNVNGLSNSYTFENQNGEWLLIDTNFHEKMTGKGFFMAMGAVLIIVLILMLPLLAFTLWMLVDAITRDIENKALWIILILLLGILGAVLYFFMERKKAKKK